MSSIKSFPNNQDQFIGAEEFMRWLHGRTSGIYGAAGNGAVTAVSGEMAVEVSDALGWLSNDEGNGITWWIDYLKKTGSKLKLNLDLADGAKDRIDRVVVSWETTDYSALPTVEILKGVPSSNAVPPALTNNNIKRQISLAQIKVNAGITSLVPSMIIDERLDSNVCGLVTSEIGIDTTMLQAQWDEWFKSIQNAFGDDVAGNLQNQINEKVDRIPGKGLSTNDYTAADKQKVEEIAQKAGAAKEFENIVIKKDGWSASAPYKKTITVPNMVDDGSANVYLVPTAENSLEYNGLIAEYNKITGGTTGTGSVTFTAKYEKPMKDLTVRIVVTGSVK